MYKAKKKVNFAQDVVSKTNTINNIMFRLGYNGSREHTTAAKTNAVAKCGPPKPSCRPTPTARAVTVAECDDGMPPDPISCFGSHRFSLYLDK